MTCVGKLFPLVLAVALTSCGGDDRGGDDPPLMCEGIDPATEAPTLACPTAMVDLGCIDPAGVAPGVSVRAAACTADPVVDCSPSIDARVSPGDTAFHCTATIPTGTSACDFTVRGIARGSIGLECVPTVSASCTGALTTVVVPDPTTIETCGTAGTIENDIPASGFTLGDTPVTFSVRSDTGTSAGCTTTVTVTDETPPMITCPASLSAVRPAPDAMATVPAISATDACDATVDVVASPPAVAMRGASPVTFTATDDAGLTATCDTTVNVLDAFAVDGLRIASARIGAGDTTAITLVWEPPGGGDATEVRIDRAPAPDGPWTELGRQPATNLRHVDTSMPGTVAYYRVVTLAGSVEGGISAPIRALAIRAAGYDVRGQTVPTVPFATTLYGVVRHPADLAAGPFPLVILIHGNHGICRRTAASSTDDCATSNDHECPTAGWVTTPNAEGMAFQAETLAAHGYVAATISANALNCRDDFLRERGQLVLEHLRRWRTWATTGGAPFGMTFAGAVDTARVGLVGHSRGGEAVAHAPGQLLATPIAGVTIRSVFAIAPTDYHDPNPGAVPYATLLPACDADVYTLDGMHTYDRALGTPGVVRAQVFYAGANHNFFNTQWRNDDNEDGLVCDVSDEIGGAAQQAMVETTLAAWFERTLAADGLDLEAFQRADTDTPLGIQAHAGRNIDLRWSHAAAERTLIDDFAGAGAPTTNRLGATNTFSGFYVSRACFENDCDRDFDHRKSAAFLSWMGAAADGALGLGMLDLSGHSALSFRIVSRRSTLNTGIATQDFTLRLVDAGGTIATMRLSDLRTLNHLYATNLPREVLQTVRIRTDWLAERYPDLDPTELTTLELDFGMGAPDRPSGSVLITDVELAR
jgi:hypothetical protein